MNCRTNFSLGTVTKIVKWLGWQNNFSDSDVTNPPAGKRSGTRSGSGQSGAARRQAAAAVKLAPKSDLRIWAALVLVRAGDPAPAEKLIGELDKEFPKNTFVQGSYLPTLRAAVALERNDPSRAIDLLKPAGRFDFGGGASFYQIYLRGEHSPTR